jgi:putative exporter of polyketide antibiotics
MDNLYMHLSVAWTVMNYSSISYLAGELYRISTMLYQVRPCVWLWRNGSSLAAGLLLTFFFLLQWVVSAIPVAHAQQDAGTGS